MPVQIKRSAALDSLNLTPLLDCIFLLLIFFLVTTRFADEDRELDVVLPSASEARPLTVKPKEVFVNIDERGRLFLGTTEMTLPEVEEALRAAVRNNPVGQSVVIRADKRVPFDVPVQVMNLCNRVGVADYSVTTAEPQ